MASELLTPSSIKTGLTWVWFHNAAQATGQSKTRQGSFVSQADDPGLIPLVSIEIGLNYQGPMWSPKQTSQEDIGVFFAHMSLSYLENARDRGAQKATVHGVTKETQLND